MSPELKAAYDQLEAAIVNIRPLIKTDHPDSLLIDWVVVMEGVRYDDDGNRLTVMDNAYRDGECRLSAAIGILTLGLEHLVETPEDDG